MNFKIRKKKVTWKQRVLYNLPVLAILLFVSLTTREKIPWQLQLILAIYLSSSIQTMLSIGFEPDRPTFKRFLKRQPIYISHVYLPLLLCAVLAKQVEGTKMVLAAMALSLLSFEIIFYLHIQTFNFILKHRTRLEKFAVPVVLIAFFAFYGLAAVGNQHLSMLIAFSLPFLAYLVLGFNQCVWTHGYSLKTLPKCLLKILVIMVVPWWVLSRQIEMSDNSRVSIALEFLCLGLFFHFIMPRLLTKKAKDDSSS
ncbi:MAG: hypothetical protein KC652_22735 [Cyanobacteria bacterium HKST-UBA01]|nr:hypothetical protein [Cyanobacteria bacterium HKST-UBA01]